MFISHITNNTGRMRRSERSAVPDAAVQAAQAWIASALSVIQPIPMSWAGPYRGAARIEQGGLIVTVYQDTELPVFAVRVALRSRHAGLWPAHETTLHKPKEPWCTTAIGIPEALPAPDDLIVIEDALMWAWKGLRTASANQ